MPMIAAPTFIGHVRHSLESIGRQLEARPGRLEFACRLALICALTALVVQLYQTPDPALTVYIVFFLNKPDRVESVILNLVFVILMSLIIGLTLLMATVVVDAPFWRVMLMSFFSVGFLFLAFAGKLRPFAGTVTLIVGYALDLIGSAHQGEIVTRALLYAWLFVAIPAGVSMVVNLTLAPPPRRLAERALAVRLDSAAKLLRERTLESFESLRELMREGNAEILTWLKLATVERTSAPKHVAALRRAATATTGILLWTEVACKDPLVIPRTHREALAETLERMAEVLRRGHCPVDISAPRLPSDTLSAQASLLWAEIASLLSRFAEPEEALQSEAQPHPAGFLLPDAFSNPEYLRYAAKTTAAAMACYLLYSLLNWPGIHTCFITCYIVALGTTAETVEKLSLRMVGCAIGALTGIAAIVYLMPALTSIAALLVVVFVGALISGWVAAGSPRISYAGFQIAFAFFICVIQGSAPGTELTTARDRVIGILLGNLVVYLLFSRAWPVSVARRVDPALVSALKASSAMVGATDPEKRQALAGQVQTTLGSIETDVALAGYEPARIRPDESWFRSRRDAAEELGELHPLLWVCSVLEPQAAALIARHLEGVAAALDKSGPCSSAEPVIAYTASTSWGSSARQRLLGLREALFESTSFAPSSREVAGHAAA